MGFAGFCKRNLFHTLIGVLYFLKTPCHMSETVAQSGSGTLGSLHFRP